MAMEKSHCHPLITGGYMTLRMGVATFLKLEHWKTQDVVGDERF